MSNLRMPDTNVVVISGRMTRDPDLRYTASGKAFVRFGIANTTYFRKENGEKGEKTVFVDVSAWDKLAEIIGERIEKGTGVQIEGRLNLEQWEDKETGSKRSKISITARRCSALEWADDEEGGGSRDSSRRASGQPADEPIPKDNIPF